MRRYAAALLAAIIFTLTLASCSSGYDTEDFIGKTSTEIVDENGDFDCVIGEAGGRWSIQEQQVRIHHKGKENGVFRLVGRGFIFHML